MKPLIQLFLIAQIALFAFAASAHFGVFGNRDDPAAGTAETIIAIVLAAGLVLTVANPAHARTSALIAQGFATLGTLVGITLVLTVGPRETFDVVVHLLMLALLGTGLIVTYREPRPTSSGPAQSG